MSELILTTAKGGQFWVDYVDTTAPENFNVFYFENESDEQPQAVATDSEDWYDAIDQLRGYCPNEALGQLWAKAHPLPDHVETDTSADDIFEGEAIRFSGTASYYRDLLPAFNFDVFIPFVGDELGAHFVSIDWHNGGPEHLALAEELLTRYLETKVKDAAELKAREFIEANKGEEL